jgi:hypothetical protein
MPNPCAGGLTPASPPAGLRAVSDPGLKRTDTPQPTPISDPRTTTVLPASTPTQGQTNYKPPAGVISCLVLPYKPPAGGAARLIERHVRTGCGGHALPRALLSECPRSFVALAPSTAGGSTGRSRGGSNRRRRFEAAFCFAPLPAGCCWGMKTTTLCWNVKFPDLP